MKANSLELSSGKNSLLVSLRKVFLPCLTLVLLTTIPFFSYDSLGSFFPSFRPHSNGSIPLQEKNNSSSMLHPSNTSASDSTSRGRGQKCNIYDGDWFQYPGGPYYTNETECVIDDRQNCMKFGRPDNEFMKWRWKPHGCVLPLFDPWQFFELVRGKTLAFVGDSVARNQMQSLVCLLASAKQPVDVSYVPDGRFRRWLYADYNFTIIALWSPHLVKAIEADADPDVFSGKNPMNLYLDEADEAWASQVENADIVIISAGQWFFGPFMYFEDGKVVGCSKCKKENITDLTLYYGYKMVFRTAFRTILRIKEFKGMVFLRTFSPAHFENGDWDKGGNCVRTKPFSKQEMKLDGFNLELYLTQIREFKAAEKRGRKRGIQFRLLDTSGAMILRPDGHPSQYGHWPSENKTIPDCVHWCMPGAVDTWNEFLLHMLKNDSEELTERKLQENA